MLVGRDSTVPATRPVLPPRDCRGAETGGVADRPPSVATDRLGARG
jgi:hypothetical protein